MMYYLKPNVMVRPLINQWYAKDMLVPPASTAMYIKNIQVELMRSYLQAPDFHAQAAKDPNLIGGPWIGYDATHTVEIEALLNKTLKEQARFIKLATDIEALDALLRKEADGRCLEPLYPCVPDTLKGLVELVYDLNSYPSIRFIEGLLYKSDYYDPNLQSFALSLMNQDYRPFQWTIPCLPDNGLFQWSIPFAHANVDELFKLRCTPQPLDYIKQLLSTQLVDEQLLMQLLTTEPMAMEEKYKEDGVRIRYFGHACLLIETKDLSILTDPLISYPYACSQPRYTLATLPPFIDYAVITHAHFDHFDLETMLQLRHRIKSVLIRKNAGGALQDPSLKLILKQIGFKDIIELEEMETLRVKDGSLTVLPFLGEHADLNVQNKAAHLIELKGNSILCAADSSNVEPQLYHHIHKLVGDIDILFLGMESSGAPLSAVYGALLTKALKRAHDQSRRTVGSNCERGLAMVKTLNVKQAYIYAMGQEPWLRHILPLDEKRDSQGIIDANRFIETCLSRGIIAERPLMRKEIVLKNNPA